MTDQKKAPKALEKLPQGQLYSEDDKLHGDQVLELVTPGVKHGSELVTSITIHPLRGLHCRQIKESYENVGDYIDLAGLMSGLPDLVFDQLGAEDVSAVVATVQGLMWPAANAPTIRFDPDEGFSKVPPPKLVAPYTVRLGEPLSHDRETVTELVFKPVTGLIARQFPVGGLAMHRTPKLIEKLTGASSGIVDQLTGEALWEALGVAQCFFGSIRSTGPGPGGS